ncbi:FAD dependent oxidoreductase-like protein [Lophiostoma macrostomum CBS 122681]|uniref:FAD dependent oxidoreductase-like protein n=1 Tax=Lophiostoma macrostomum CBS 122681 TaxID=1314788 RepID=A0A6A6TNQ5_9PLEO|nr:FAD dependent oxidoreductase-like protein [Lophiostoma macrostomum CBS 122681]
MESRGRIPVGPPVADPLPSYWHNPKSPLANVIEPGPDSSSNVYDFVIIGSGISGTLIAYSLLKNDPSAKVVMLEAREACGGATGRNGGHTKAASYRTYLQYRKELGKEEALKIARLEYTNIFETHQLAEKLVIDCENHMCNTIDLIYDGETFECGRAAIETLQADASDEERQEGGMACYKIYSKEEAASKFHVDGYNSNPKLAEEEQLAGAFEYVAGRINAYRFTTRVLKECVKKGLKVCTNTPVHKVLPASHTMPGSEEQPYFVYTQYNTIQAQSVIYATNGYTPYLLPQLQGVIVPLRGQITAQQPGPHAKFPVPLPTTYSFIYRSGYEYMIPRTLPEGGQHIVIGGGLGREPQAGAEEYGTVDDSSLNHSISRYLNGSLVGYFGTRNWGEDEGQQPKDERVVQEWTGIMGATADGRPLVGRVPGTKGNWISAGFNGHGMVLCLKSANALVQAISGKSSEEIPWFPHSFWINEDRVQSGTFGGRTDMRVPETGAAPVET